MFTTLKIFAKVYETENFSKAAELLYISQPTISLKMKQLETDLNTTLFIRQGMKSIKPTEEAALLYERVKQMIDLWDDTTNLLHKEVQKPIPFTIACSNTFGLYYIPKMIPSFCDVFPQVALTVKMTNSEEALQQVIRHEATIGLIEKPIITNDVMKKILFEDELVLAGRDDSVWLMREARSGLHFFNELYFAEQGFTPPILTLNNDEMIRQMLLLGVGRTIFPKIGLENIPFQPLAPKYKRTMYLVARNTYDHKIVEQCMKWIEQYFEAYLTK